MKRSMINLAIPNSRSIKCLSIIQTRNPHLEILKRIKLHGQKETTKKRKAVEIKIKLDYLIHQIYSQN